MFITYLLTHLQTYLSYTYKPICHKLSNSTDLNICQNFLPILRAREAEIATEQRQFGVADCTVVVPVYWECIGHSLRYLFASGIATTVDRSNVDNVLIVTKRQVAACAFEDEL